MELEDFDGKIYGFSGIDFIQIDEAWNVVVVLNGIPYTFEEDPDDGYRSCFGEVTVQPYIVKNRFDSTPVKCMYSYDEDSEEVLTLVSTINKKEILRIGTDFSDFYYPSFISEYTPENIPKIPKIKQPSILLDI